MSIQPGKIIIDFYHAREHQWNLARELYRAEEAAQKRWLMHKLDWLDNGKIEKLTAALGKLADSHSNPELIKAIRGEVEYFDNIRDRMRYPEFREQNLFVGSGVIEAGCKPWLALASNNPACSGLSAVRTPSSLSVAAVSAANLRIFESSGQVDHNFHVAHLAQLENEIRVC